MSPHVSSKIWNVAIVALLTASATPSQAALVLTSQGSAQGFTLSTFASGFSSTSGLGPLGIGFPSNGTVLVSDAFGVVRVFPNHSDGQTTAGAVIGANYNTVIGSLGIANVGSSLFMATHNAGTVIPINSLGQQAGAAVATGISSSRDIVLNPNNGHLFVSGSNGIWDVDLVGGTKNLFKSFDTDGLSIDGTILYAATGFGVLRGFRLSDGVEVFTVTINGVDGTALGNGILAGKIFANTNFGEVWMIDTANPLNKVLIASGGSRGDLVKVDPLNGTLLLTQSDSVVRLTAPAGGGFGNVQTAVPEPATWLMLVSALITFGVSVARRSGARLRTQT